jgi:hypothetical protein
MTLKTSGLQIFGSHAITFEELVILLNEYNIYPSVHVFSTFISIYKWGLSSICK